MTYIRIPQTISYDELHDKLSFSPKNYEGIFCKNKNTINLWELLKKEIRGREIGSSSYISNSSCFFVRTGALNKSNFLLEYEKDSILPMKPEDFLNMELKKWQIIISKDGNVWECIVVDRNLKKYMLSWGLVCIDIDKSIKYYCFAFMKSDFLKDQVLQKISKWATLLHAKETRKDCIIPFPNQANKDEVIHYLSLLVQSVINKEQAIKAKYEKMMEMISEELKSNQNNKSFVYQSPKYNELQELLRLDAWMFTKEYKQELFAIENYKNWSTWFYDLWYDLKRWQNLQVSTIWKSIYSDTYQKWFYEMVRPTYLTDYWTIERFEYLGNAKELQTINQWDIIFSAEWSIGKSHVFIDDVKKTITNIHWIVVYSKTKREIFENVFLWVFLGYMRKQKMFDYMSVWWQGGSMGQKYWKYIKIPNFPDTIKQQISDLYYHPTSYSSTISLDTFVDSDNTITAQSGITQLDQQIKTIKNHINTIVDQIINDEEVEIRWEFLHT